MTHQQDDANNVISIFQRHRHGEPVHLPDETRGEMIESPDGFRYVSVREDLPLPSSANHPQAEPSHLDIAHKKHYLFKFMEHHKDHVRIDNYYVPGERLGEFMTALPNRPGQLIEIQQFIPDTLG